MGPGAPTQGRPGRAIALTPRGDAASKTPMASSVLASAPVRAILSGAIAGYIWLVHRTTRWRVEGGAHLDAATAEGKVIAVFWHNRIMMTPVSWPKDAPRPRALVSKSADGDVIAAAAAKFDVGAVRGSSANMRKKKDKGALAAFREMARHVKSGGCMAITPDGPRGPRMRMQEGVVRLAQLTGAPILPMAWSTKRRKTFQSWDRFILPLPFTEGVIIWGEPLSAPREVSEAELEAFRAHAESALIAVADRADAATGHAPILQGEAS